MYIPVGNLIHSVAVVETAVKFVHAVCKVVEAATAIGARRVKYPFLLGKNIFPQEFQYTLLSWTSPSEYT